MGQRGLVNWLQLDRDETSYSGTERLGGLVIFFVLKMNKQSCTVQVEMTKCDSKP